VDLNRIYFLHGGARIKHFLLLSRSGKQANLVKDEWDMLSEIYQSNQEIRHLGVHHGDLHWSNALWNSQLGRVQLIDFHKSKLLHSKPRPKRKRTTMDDMSPSKRVNVHGFL
jgi:predicted unusual protein kinase regulating ubiquinone biosynthesis (AarF/ABC1/UbiB family)